MNRFIQLISVGLLLFAIISCNQPLEKPAAQDVAVDSVSYYSNLIQQDSSNYRYFARRAALYLEKENVNAAFRDLSYALELNETDPALFVLLSDIYFIIGKTENSINSLEKALELKPDFEEALLKLSEIYLILRDYEKSALFANRTRSLNIDNSEAYYLLGIGHMEQGDTNQAILQLQLSANLDSLHYPAMMQLGLLFSSRHDSTSIDYYEMALEAKPRDEAAFYYLASEHQSFGHFSKALSLFDSLTTLYPTSRRPYYHKGYIYLVEMKDYDKAEICFTEAITVDPRYVEAVYNLGRTYEAKGNLTLAEKQYRQALELLPNYPLAIQGLNRILE